MKVFVLTVILLLVLVLLVGINALYINNVANRMLSRLEKLPDIDHPDCVSHARELLAFWESCADTVNLTVSFSAVDRITEQAKLLLACAEHGDALGFHSALTLLFDTVADLKRLETFDVGNLF